MRVKWRKGKRTKFKWSGPGTWSDILAVLEEVEETVITGVVAGVTKIRGHFVIFYGDRDTGPELTILKRRNMRDSCTSTYSSF